MCIFLPDHSHAHSSIVPFVRVTKDVLVVSNGILMEAKRFFKDSIEYARPEIAVKDLGTRVRMLGVLFTVSLIWTLHSFC